MADSVRPATVPALSMRNISIKKIYQVDAHHLGIDWTDGLSGKWRLADLRRKCPCAVCVDEYTRERILDPSTIANDLAAKNIQSVGQYAIQVFFSDGHSTGIFSYDYLRSL